jgi:antirestriction protein ArdC
VSIFKVYRVFNLEQTTLEPTHYPTPEFKEEAITTLLNKLGTTVSHFGNSAYYNNATDAIVLPQPDRFSSKQNYYATLLHELTHWTGGNDERVPRQCFTNYGLDIKARAEEELIAEIGSVLLAIHFGLRGELENHASYVQNWKQHLDEKQVMRAANKAAKAFEWIIKAAE